MVQKNPNLCHSQPGILGSHDLFVELYKGFWLSSWLILSPLICANYVLDQVPLYTLNLKAIGCLICLCQRWSLIVLNDEQESEGETPCSQQHEGHRQDWEKPEKNIWEMIHVEHGGSDSGIHERLSNPCHHSLWVCRGPWAQMYYKWQVNLSNCQAAHSCLCV